MSLKRSLLFPFAFVALPALLFCLGVFYYLDHQESVEAFEQLIEEHTENLKLKNDYAIQYFNPLIADINFLAETLTDIQGSNEQIDTQKLATTLYTYMMLNPDYYQLRILDTTGFELIKWVNNDGLNRVPDELLQDKSDRDYFLFGSTVNNGEVYISKLELNIEGDTIELPYRPVIRLVAPLAHENGTRLGYIVSNYDLQLYLNSVKEYYLLQEGSFSFLNREGYWLSGPDHKAQWAFMFNDSTRSFPYLHPEIWETMITERSGYAQVDSGYYVFEEINPAESLPRLAKKAGIELKMINKRKGYTLYFLSNEYVTDSIYTWRKQALPMLGITAMFIIVISLAWAVYRKRDEDKKIVLEAINQKLLESEASLVERNEELEQFGHITSHDLQEPLRTIKSYITIIDRRYTDKLDETGHKSMAFVVEAAARMEKLIQELRNLHKQKVRTIPEKFDSNSLVKDVIRDLESLIGESNTQIEVQNKLPTIVADKAKLGLVFQNLIINAIKHAPAGEKASITIGCKNNMAYHLFFVKDDGKTIDPKHYDRIFHIFRRLQGDAEDGGASGMGLTICKAIINQHNGKLWIEPNKNKGNIFYFTIPKQDAAEN